MANSGVSIHITGVVQGVGFRPFVYSLARRLDLTGWVNNTSAGVDIEADGPAEVLATFTRRLRDEAPALARIDSLEVMDRQANGFEEFTIRSSKLIEGAYQPISPDVSICLDCLAELFDPLDRRYRYPFINCTNCGPRFTIIEDIPYDRPLTTMADFALCPSCSQEYSNPLDRRFHAQPIACPDCGPHVWLEINTKQAPNSANYSKEIAIQVARNLLRQGKIVAIKGLGGFHLCCDATNPDAVSLLRQRKLRVDKPFGLMMPDFEAVAQQCWITSDEREALESRGRPIVILRRQDKSKVARSVAPGQNTLGVMLPYTPLHYLLLERSPYFPEALVMTSGNLSEEPIAITNQAARERLANLADAFLFHDRDIRTRNDDSVIRILPEEIGSDQPHFYSIRRSRGYAPYPIRLPWDTPPLLATGAELKNTFCLANGRRAFLSQHIGDMENYETLQAFEEGISHLSRLFRVDPQAIAYDLHPNYLATQLALQWSRDLDLPSIGIQHHHAHIASCMAEHGFNGQSPVIGITFDGTGYGDDGAIWGGEIMLADYSGYQRLYHLSYCPMPGGEKAIREPWRLALSWLKQAGINWNADLAPVCWAKEQSGADVDLLAIVENQMKSGLNSPITSSMGRLFDAISALVGIRQTVNYEAQAAIELEAIADDNEHSFYRMGFTDGIIEAESIFQDIVTDLEKGLPKAVISARFHNSIANLVVDICQHIRAERGVKTVVLSGGVWQNMTLLIRTIGLLKESGFEVKYHQQVPTNDGGLSLGQVAIASYQLVNNHQIQMRLGSSN